MKFQRIVSPTPTRNVPGLTSAEASDLHFVDAVRSQLTSDYPRIRPAHILAVMVRHGRMKLPEALLLRAGPGNLVKLLRTASFRSVEWHPLFSASFYEAAYPDVALTGVSAWLHYQCYGHAEGRSPHPLIDATFLAQSLPATVKSSIVDEYLTVRSSWTLDTSPYVDCRRFLLEGEWDGRTNPLEQIVTGHLREPWVHERLMLIDSPTEEAARTRLVAAGALLIAHGRDGAHARFSRWTVSEPQAPASGDQEYLVIPGFLLGVDGVVIEASPTTLLSPDRTGIRTSEGVLTISAGPLDRADQVVYLDGPAPVELLRELAAPTPELRAISPASKAQEVALRMMANDDAVMVLRHGQQVRLRARSVMVIHPEPPSTSTLWGPEQADSPADIVFVFSQASRHRARLDPYVNDAVTRGAAMAVLSEDLVEDWLPLLQSRSVVVVDDELVELVGAFVEASRMRVLPAGERGNLL